MQFFRKYNKLLIVGINLLLLATMVGLMVLPSSGTAYATAHNTSGCENNPHQISGQTYYQCMVIATAPGCLNVRNAMTFAIEACLPDGSRLYVARQTRHTLTGILHGGPIWDILKGGQQVVSDYYINTSQIDNFSPPIPNNNPPGTATPTSSQTATPTATKGTATPSPTATVPSGTITPTGTPITPGLNTRLFSASSPWNVAIGSNVQLDPNSTNMVNMLAGGSHVAAMYQYGMPIYVSTASDPTYTVDDTGNDALFSAQQPIHIPNTAAVSPGTDHWLFIYDTTKNLLFEMWNTSKSGNTWTTQTGDVYSPSGDGVLQIDGSPQSGNGASYFGGVITDADVQRGSIDHALSLASEFTSSEFRPPMVASDGHTNGGVPMGARLQLDPSVNCSTLPGASTGEKMVCQALETYGGYMRDTGGVALSAYFEGENLNDPSRNPPTNPGDPGLSNGPFGKLGLSDGMDLSAIPWDKLRVLKSWNSFSQG